MVFDFIQFWLDGRPGNFSQNFWSFDSPNTPGCASVVFAENESVVFAENEIWNRSATPRFLRSLQINKFYVNTFLSHHKRLRQKSQTFLKLVIIFVFTLLVINYYIVHSNCKCFTHVTKTRANLTTYCRKPENYNGTTIFEIDIMKNLSPINLNLCQTWLFHKFFGCFFCFDLLCHT